MQPPETEPASRPSPQIASSAPSGRGEEPQVRTTVASVTGSPAACQATAWRKVSRLTLSMSVPRYGNVRSLNIGYQTITLPSVAG